MAEVFVRKWRISAGQIKISTSSEVTTGNPPQNARNNSGLGITLPETNTSHLKNVWLEDDSSRFGARPPGRVRTFSFRDGIVICPDISNGLYGGRVWVIRPAKFVISGIFDIRNSENPWKRLFVQR